MPGIFQVQLCKVDIVISTLEIRKLSHGLSTHHEFTEQVMGGERITIYTKWEPKIIPPDVEETVYLALDVGVGGNQ